MARRSRKRARNDQLDGSSDHQEAQEQPAEVNAEKPQLLHPETELTLPKVPEIKMVEEKEVKKIEGKAGDESNQFRNEPDSTPAKETITKSVNGLDSTHRELCPKLDPLSPKDSNPALLPELEAVVVKNETNGLSTEPDTTTPRKKRKKKKGKSLSTNGGAEANDVQSEHRELIPNLDPLSPKSDPVLLPESEPVVEKNETNKLCGEPESSTPRKKKRRKRKGKSLSMSEGIETKDGHSKHRELIPDLDPLTPKDLNSVLLPEPESFAGKNDRNQLCPEPELVTPRKKKRKGKRKSLSNNEGLEANHVDSEHRELSSNLVSLPPKDPDTLLPPEPAPANQLCTQPDSTSPKFERPEIKDMDSENLELFPKVDPLTPKDSNSVLLPEPESFADENDNNQLCTEPELVTPRKKKRKGKRKSLSKSEGVEVIHVDSEHRELCSNLVSLPPKDPDLLLLPEPVPANKLCTQPDSTPLKFEGAEIKDMDSENLELFPKLDPLTSKDSNSVLISEPEFADKNKSNHLCTEPELVTPRKKKRKGKRKSLSNSEGVEVNHVGSEHSELCSSLVSLPPKDPDSLLLPEPAAPANELCTQPDSTSPKFEGAEIKDVDSENLELSSKLDPLPSKDSGPPLLLQSKPAPPEGAEQKKKRKNKKKKNKGNLEGEGVESIRPNDEHSQQCPKAMPTTPEEQNQRKRKRQAMNETRNSSVRLMVTPNYALIPTGTSILNINSETKGCGPWIPKSPLKGYERYERCLECGQICQEDQTCRGLRHLRNKNTQICFFCGTFGHLIGNCPISPGAKCAKGIIMLDDYVRKRCWKRSMSSQRKVAPANVPTYAQVYTPFPPSYMHPYRAPFVRPTHAPFEVWRN